jgi:hypothetical protein
MREQLGIIIISSNFRQAAKRFQYLSNKNIKLFNSNSLDGAEYSKARLGSIELIT